MRKTMLILSLAGLTVLAGASDAFAQRRGYSGGRGGASINVGRSGYNAPYRYYGGGASPYRYYGGGLGYSPFYLGLGLGIAQSAYYATPNYYAAPTYVVPMAQVRDSFYAAPVAVQQSVNIAVLVPAADAQVWFENRLTAQNGMERLFHSPPLDPSHSYTYTIKARWMENGQAVIRERQVNVQSGQNVTVNFRESAREIVPLPKLPNAIPRD
jgi:uncharacterized protein (TIGR03000 family)